MVLAFSESGGSGGPRIALYDSRARGVTMRGATCEPIILESRIPVLASAFDGLLPVHNESVVCKLLE